MAKSQRLAPGSPATAEQFDGNTGFIFTRTRQILSPGREISRGLGRTAGFWASCPWPSASYSSKRRGKGTPQLPSATSLCLTVVPAHLDRTFGPASCFPLPRKLKEKKNSAGSGKDSFWPLRRFSRIDVAASGFRDKNFLETRKRPPLLYQSDQNGPWLCLLSFSRGWPRFCELGPHTPGPWPVRELPPTLIPRPFTD